jgi:hypothetical protein
MLHGDQPVVRFFRELEHRMNSSCANAIYD